MIQRCYRILGWICVVLGACVPFGVVWSLYRGQTLSRWEPLVLVCATASTVMVGLAFALPNLGPRFAVVALSTWAAFLIVFGVVALLWPAEVLVTRGRGPRTVFMAQLRGGLMLGLGGVLIAMAVVRAGRLRQKRAGTHDATTG